MLSKYVVRRIAFAVLTWMIAMCVLFILPRLTPTSPESLLASSYRLPEQASVILCEKFGLDQPIGTQFLLFLKNVVFTFPPDFGFSYVYYPMHVWDIIIMHLGWSLFLLLTALIMTLVVGGILGIVMAWKRGSKLEKLLSGLAVASFSSPVFWVGYLLIIVFAMIFPIFPPAGAYSSDITSSFSLEFIFDVLKHAILPASALVITQAPAYAILLRDNMLYALREDYVITAEAKGVRERTIVFKHAARNAILPIITLFAMQIGLMFGGQIMVEIVFSYPGVGKLIYDAILGLDFPVVIGFFYVVVTLGIISNIVADLIYPYIDPRVRYE